ncbi:MAG TPA: hypothetical protein VFB81_20115, partial [Myxococcales bacterium]|nr:hypothetical protein [Myxococcales bacterium]
SRAIGDALSASQPLLDEKLRTDPSGMVKIVENGLQVFPGAHSLGSEALKSDGIERVIGMSGKYQGEGAYDVHAQMFKAGAAKLGPATNPNQAELVKGLGDLYTSNTAEITRALYDAPGNTNYRDTSNQMVPRLIRDAFFNGQDPTFARNLGTAMASMSDDPSAQGMTMRLVQEGYQAASTQLTKSKEGRDTALGAFKDFGAAALDVGAPGLSPFIKKGLEKLVELGGKQANDDANDTSQTRIAELNQALQDSFRPPLPQKGEKRPEAHDDYDKGWLSLDQVMRQKSNAPSK